MMRRTLKMAIITVTRSVPKEYSKAHQSKEYQAQKVKSIAQTPWPENYSAKTSAERPKFQIHIAWSSGFELQALNL